MQTGVLLLNIGTPANPSPAAIRAYLTAFLNDPAILPLPTILRQILVKACIVPLRYRRITHAYQQIWQSEGSPLLIHSQQLTRSLAECLGKHYHIALGMYHGQPNIASALHTLRDCQLLHILPLFPQYSYAASGVILTKTLQTLVTPSFSFPMITLYQSFYHYPGFAKTYATLIKHRLAKHHAVDCLLFSYHGLPITQLAPQHCLPQCNRRTPCPVQQYPVKHYTCYRAACYATSHAIMAQLTELPLSYHVAFQSRLGYGQWIPPYTNQLLPKLIQAGVRTLAVTSPSFVIDCLETLEEINIRLRHQWQQLGGQSFIFIPCLNDHALWVEHLARLIRHRSMHHIRLCHA